MMKKILDKLNEAYLMLSTIPVQGDSVDVMAAAKTVLREAAGELKDAGSPAKPQGFVGGRRSTGMSELSPTGGSEGYGGCDDVAAGAGERSAGAASGIPVGHNPRPTERGTETSRPPRVAAPMERDAGDCAEKGAGDEP